MKRFCSGLFLMAAIAMLSAASSVAWEGRAAVGTADSFPSGGRYAQSRVFAKGEIVEVYNTVNGKTSNVVITGSTDLAGVLILLSPSVANDLEITGGYDTVVRISRKNDYVVEKPLTDGVKTSVADPDTNANAILKNDLVYTEERKPADFVEPKQNIATELTNENVQNTQNTQNVQIEENFNDAISSEPVVASNLNTQPTENVQNVQNVQTAQVAQNFPQENKVEENKNAEIAKNVATPPLEGPTVAPVAETKKPESVYDYSKLPPAPNYGTCQNPVCSGYCTCGSYCRCPNPCASYVPQEQNQVPPQVNVTIAQYPSQNLANTSETVKDAKPAQQSANAQIEKSTASQVAPVTVHNYSAMPYPEYLINQYESGKYYVQLGVFRDMANLSAVVKKYEKKYPISIKASEITSNAYELLIGSLSSDEYTAVLNKFRKDGFKDAFIKSKK